MPRAMVSNKTHIPQGWRLVRLGDVARERNQRASSNSLQEVFSVTKHAGLVRSLEYFDRQVFSRDTSNYKLVRRGDLAYATIHLNEGSLGILRDAATGVISPMYTVIEADTIIAEPEFLFSIMKLPQMVSLYQRIGEGTVHRRKSISFERLGTLTLAMPTIQEQRRILAVLDSIDDAIVRTESVIAATEQLRDSLLHQLLTPRRPRLAHGMEGRTGVGDYTGGVGGGAVGGGVGIHDIRYECPAWSRRKNRRIAYEQSEEWGSRPFGSSESGPFQ